MAIQAPKGTKDVIPKESYKWQYLEGLARELCQLYGFREVRTPVIEHTELFLRGVGDTTDIVQKEMYTFDDRGGRSITLKPEGTAGAARMFLENGLFNDAQPTKMYYLNCPVFRYDKPQAGRLREHHQFGVEVYGAPLASADAECIRLAMALLGKVGVRHISVHINSIGCPNCRPAYNDALRSYLRGRYGELCDVCKSRFEKNPLRILDCKEERCRAVCQGAPTILDCLCGECAEHFSQLQGCLAGVGVQFKVDPYIVRGLDYYTKTVFEIIAECQGYTGTVCGGGRYDGLIAELGGPQLPGVGFGMGMERLLLVAELSGAAIPLPPSVDVYIAALGEAARSQGFALVDGLRAQGIRAEFDHVGRSFKAQFKYADKLGARKVAILGDDELSKGCVKLKDMASGEERLLPLEELAGALKN
ncbi:MAG: histidine--tRNA ligase [Candidatus Pelethousia sp.]|nr:histidine--tRNA ligase [Candidatus Pelethousia sp.]